MLLVLIIIIIIIIIINHNNHNSKHFWIILKCSHPFMGVSTLELSRNSVGLRVEVKKLVSVGKSRRSKLHTTTQGD